MVKIYGFDFSISISGEGSYVFFFVRYELVPVCWKTNVGLSLGLSLEIKVTSQRTHFVRLFKCQQIKKKKNLNYFPQHLLKALCVGTAVSTRADHETKEPWM